MEGLDALSHQNLDQSFRGNNQSVMISESVKTPIKEKHQKSFTEGLDNANAFYDKTQNILDKGPAMEDKLQDLSSRLNLLLDKHKNKRKDSKEAKEATAHSTSIG